MPHKNGTPSGNENFMEIEIDDKIRNGNWRNGKQTCISMGMALPLFSSE